MSIADEWQQSKADVLDGNVSGTETRLLSALSALSANPATVTAPSAPLGPAGGVNHDLINSMLVQAVKEKIPKGQWYLTETDTGQFGSVPQKGATGSYNDGLTSGVGRTGKVTG
ncbi:hypothetical protein OG497_14680 [Streptomyces sp. NBC_01242]|uniref:hypothetical protein n=1 Tax=unclassified Streptomyces TaxID=2593676 RepID=UPI002258AEEF|nr:MULTISPECIES: hypothetical protein [unclassified Streptomyces]MCX4795324.1 hypothetical protein [Streptomyces sp. NBC_01242]WSJ36631.1 hypothetical protein OG772_11675 [Streptomyces sp. NBC_01321]WSU22158.1 hypothetical protein OG508_15060 [Streptomyces sp. NBC_01108]